MRSWVVVAALGLALPSGAQGFAPRDTAQVGSRGSYRVGLFAPLRYGLGRGLEVETHPLLFLVAPNARLRVAHGTLGGFRLTGEYGLSTPTPALRLAKGYLTPAWKSSDRRVGWIVVPRVGLVASREGAGRGVFTVTADVARGVGLTRNDLSPLDAPAPLDLVMAPALRGWRGHAGVSYDASLTRWLRARVAGEAYLHPPSPSRVSFRAGASLDLRTTERTRLSLGVLAWNANQRERNAAGVPVRSYDVLPTADFIWEGGRESE